MKNDIKLKGWLQGFMGWPFYLGAIVLLMTGVAYSFSVQAGLICTGLTVVYLMIAGWFFLIKRPLIMRELLVFAVNHAQIQKQLLSDLDVPYALLDEQGRILWVNHAFSGVVRKDKNWKRKLSDLFPELQDKELSPFEEERIYDVSYENRYYRLHLKNIYMSDESELEEEEGFSVGLIAAYLFD